MTMGGPFFKRAGGAVKPPPHLCECLSKILNLRNFGIKRKKL
jgi:hypothetical protein